MKVSMSKFYHEVTGAKTANSDIVMNALQRWGVPFERNGKRGDAVDVVHLEAARKIREIEQAGIAERRAKKEAAIAKKRAPNETDLLALFVKLDDDVNALSKQLEIVIQRLRDETKG